MTNKTTIVPIPGCGWARITIDNKSDIDQNNNFNTMSLYEARMREDMKRIKAHAKATVNGYGEDNLKVKALLNGATLGSIRSVNELLQQGMSVNFKNSCGITPLIAAAERGYIEIVQALIQAGADLNARDNTGSTALIRAAYNGHTGIIKALIEAGADLDLKDNNKNTALMLAAKYDFMKIVYGLCKNGADLRFSPDKTILDCPQVLKIPGLMEELETLMIKQLNQKIEKGYKDLRFEKADAEVAHKLYNKTQYKDNKKLQETIKLFDEASTKYIGDTLLGAQLPIYPTEYKLFEGKLKPAQKEGTKIFKTVPDDSPQKHAVRDDSKISGYSGEKTDMLSQKDIADLLGKYLEIRDIGRLRQVSKIIKTNTMDHDTEVSGDSIKDEVSGTCTEPSILGHQDENDTTSICQ
ncbi:hypothetical protein phytr_10510 [Candidatus Phycorickettsia trachydisci]|uniref:Uncharacterized protein n=1 Tax=Candidatus Phycorickettsia trachydisci TaxID=2115978 RepID=A0A2P1P9P3_9RICK|nr:ankyrin repeat domain-containing protein [Candidatus Phycorickettsia trachydisci]AVP87979.1 hypothetical protein phytr_10510 [Candidatus Phycorickettsia trachydisci]